MKLWDWISHYLKPSKNQTKLAVVESRPMRSLVVTIKKKLTSHHTLPLTLSFFSSSDHYLILCSNSDKSPAVETVASPVASHDSSGGEGSEAASVGTSEEFKTPPQEKPAVNPAQKVKRYLIHGCKYVPGCILKFHVNPMPNRHSPSIKDLHQRFLA